MITALWIFFSYVEKDIPWKLAGIWVTFLAMTAALQVLPAYYYGRQAVRWVGLPEPLHWNQTVPFSIHQQYSLGWSTLFGLFIPGIARESTPYVGPVLLALVAIAVGACWSQARVRCFTTIALASVLFALGSQNVLYGPLYALVPMIEKARSPSLAIVFAGFAAAVLAAFGYDAVRAGTVWVRRVSFWMAAGGALVLVLVLAVMLNRQLQFAGDERVVGSAFLMLLMAALLSAYHGQNVKLRVFSICCVLLSLLDLGSSTGYNYVHEREQSNAVYLRRLTDNPDVIGWLQSHPGSRVAQNRNLLPANWGDWFGMEFYNGYVASLPESVVMLGLEGYRPRMLYGARFYISDQPRDADQKEVFAGKRGMKIYESPSALPRVWTVHRVVQADSNEQAIAQFYDPEARR